jgi:hypothetical protein
MGSLANRPGSNATRILSFAFSVDKLAKFKPAFAPNFGTKLLVLDVVSCAFICRLKMVKIPKLNIVRVNLFIISSLEYNKIVTVQRWNEAEQMRYTVRAINCISHISDLFSETGKQKTVR